MLLKTNDLTLKSLREKRDVSAIAEAKEDRYPRIGPFYFYEKLIIAPNEYQRRVNPVTFEVKIIEGFIAPGEHRDMWDKYMVVKYPELVTEYDDDHKALPRGRVDFTVKSSKLGFFITLDRCIKGQEVVGCGAKPHGFLKSKKTAN